MERSDLDSTKTKRSPTWVPDDKNHHHSQYLKRLAELRDDLIGQEKSNLAHALERLRLSSITNTSSIYRLRLRDGKAFPSPRRPLITTYEKFRQMRPAKLAPKLSPLQGKQLIEPKPNPAGWSDKKNGIARMAEIDQTAHANLQRFSQPIISSIPNIGRKAYKREDLVLNSSGANRRKTRAGHQTYINPFSQSYSPSTKSDVIDLRPESFKIDYVPSVGHIDDKLRKLYYFYYVPSKLSPRGREKASPKIIRKPVTISRTRFPLRQGSNRSMTSSELTTIRSDNQLDHLKRPGVTSRSDSNMTFPNDCSFSVVDCGVSRDVAEDSDEMSGRLSRRQIRVDMPTIIFKCPTPVPREFEDDNSGIGNLSKMCKQSEIRQRELKNLFEDVKELNMRTNSLTQLELSLQNE